MFALDVQQLTKVYGKKKKAFTAVDEISFSLKEGEILGFLGPNGSGKTTTIQMLLGILTPTSGSIFYFGKNFAQNRSKLLQHIAFASTYTSLPYILTIEENLNIVAKLYGISNIARICDPLLERFGILDKKKANVASLSAGQVTRLMLVKAFCIHPKIVLLDEPTASLDPDVAYDVCDFLQEQRETTGTSILFTSHKMEEVSTLCDRVIFLRRGHIVADDLPQNLVGKVSLHRLRLLIADKKDEAIKVARERKLRFSHDHRLLDFSLKEEEIPPLLIELTRLGIVYSSIKVEEPSLDDYFRLMAKESHE